MDSIYPSSTVLSARSRSVHLEYPSGGCPHASAMMCASTSPVTFAGIGGGTVASVRLGRGDVDGANQVFMHSLLENIVIFLRSQLRRYALSTTDSRHSRR